MCVYFVNVGMILRSLMFEFLGKSYTKKHTEIPKEGQEFSIISTSSVHQKNTLTKHTKYH